jgi:hypothetical protein
MLGGVICIDVDCIVVPSLGGRNSLRLYSVGVARGAMNCARTVFDYVRVASGCAATTVTSCRLWKSWRAWTMA